MELGNFEKWHPFQNISVNYNVDTVKIENGELVVFFNPDIVESKLTSEMISFVIRFDAFLCYQVTKESFREDLWINDPNAAWNFYKTTQSQYIECMKSKCMLFPDDVVHYIFIGESLIVDVIVEAKAKILVTKS